MYAVFVEESLIVTMFCSNTESQQWMPKTLPAKDSPSQTRKSPYSKIKKTLKDEWYVAINTYHFRVVLGHSNSYASGPPPRPRHQSPVFRYCIIWLPRTTHYCACAVVRAQCSMAARSGFCLNHTFKQILGNVSLAYLNITLTWVYSYWASLALG